MPGGDLKAGMGLQKGAGIRVRSKEFSEERGFREGRVLKGIQCGRELRGEYRRSQRRGGASRGGGVSGEERAQRGA